MGREIVFEVREDNVPIWPDPNDIDVAMFVCGRDDATGYIAQLVRDQIDDILDSDEEMTVDNLPDDAYVLFLTCKDYEKYLDIKRQLHDFLDKDNKEVQKAKDTIEDLREARRHSSYDDFFQFSESIEKVQAWIDDNSWSRAGTMIEYLDSCYNKMLELVNTNNNPDRDYVINKYKVAIILSE